MSEQKVRDVFSHLESNPEAEGRRKPKGATHLAASAERPSVNFLSPVTFFGLKELYQELVVSSTSDPLVERLGWSLEEICSQWNWAPGSGFLNISEFSLTRRLARNALPLVDWAFMPDCLHCGSGQEEMALHAFYFCKQCYIIKE